MPGHWRCSSAGLRDAAKDVAEGQFGRRAELIRNAPAEMVSFASDFNAMTGKLAR